MLLKNNSYNTEKTAPTRLDFFGRFQRLLGPLTISQRLLGMASGILSGIVFAYILYTQLPPTTPTNLAYAGMLLAFALGYVIFDGFYIYIAETWFRMARDGSFKTDKSHAIMFVFLFCIGGAIWYIDFINSTKAGEILGGKTAERPNLAATDTLIAMHTKQTQTITQGITAQTQLYNSALQNQITAKQKVYDAKIQAKQAEKTPYSKLANEGNTWAKNQIAKIDKSINALEAQKANEIAKAQTATAKNIEKTGKKTDEALATLTTQNAAAVETLNRYNNIRISQFETEYQKFSHLGWLITCFLSIAPTLVTLLKVLIEVGAGIAITTEVRRRGLGAIIAHKWQAAKERFYNLIDKEGALPPQPLQNTQTNPNPTPAIQTNQDPLLATNPTPQKQTLNPAGFYVPKDGFLKSKYTPDEDCRSCTLPTDTNPPQTPVITNHEQVITTAEPHLHISTISRISATTKALMSKLRKGNAPATNAARVHYLCDTLTQATLGNNVELSRKTPEQYTHNCQHITTTEQAYQYLNTHCSKTLAQIGETLPAQ